MLQVYDLYKQYRGVPALQGATLAVEPGETVVLMGPSGCGKSTLIRCINRLTEPDAGEIWFNGEAVRAMSATRLQEYRRQVGFVFQHFNLIARLTVLQNVMLGLVMAGRDKEAAEKAAYQALKRVGIHPHLHDRLPAALSGGQRQRVGIARALAAKPSLMLWDEPTAALDPILVQEVLDVMEELATSAKAGMLIVTHELAFAMRVADRLLIMDEGRIVEEGAPRQVFTAPSSAVGQRYQRLWESRYLDVHHSIRGRQAHQRQQTGVTKSVVHLGEGVGATGCLASQGNSASAS
jgi:polar amino acid transport system ATP-binding protein